MLFADPMVFAYTTTTSYLLISLLRTAALWALCVGFKKICALLFSGLALPSTGSRIWKRGAGLVYCSTVQLLHPDLVPNIYILGQIFSPWVAG